MISAYFRILFCTCFPFASACLLTIGCMPCAIPVKTEVRNKGDICKDSVGGNTCISVQLKDQEIEYDNNDSRGKLQYKRGNSQETNISGAF